MLRPAETAPTSSSADLPGCGADEPIHYAAAVDRPLADQEIPGGLGVA
jgi:hypothetical protein